METKVLIPTGDNIKYAAGLINAGLVVGMPTETVYGLAANAFDAQAVGRIFEAKGRPQDNPLIVHINSLAMLDCVTAEVSPMAFRLAQRFWPGPLTMIFKKSEKIPSVVTAGLDTVGVRFPSHKAAQALIGEAGVPLAAPSANCSGCPSPTTANHVYHDLNLSLIHICQSRFHGFSKPAGKLPRRRRWVRSAGRKSGRRPGNPDNRRIL